MNIYYLCYWYKSHQLSGINWVASTECKEGIPIHSVSDIGHEGKTSASWSWLRYIHQYTVLNTAYKKGNKTREVLSTFVAREISFQGFSVQNLTGLLSKGKVFGSFCSFSMLTQLSCPKSMFPSDAFLLHMFEFISNVFPSPSFVWVDWLPFFRMSFPFMPGLVRSMDLLHTPSLRLRFWKS